LENNQFKSQLTVLGQIQQNEAILQAAVAEERSMKAIAGNSGTSIAVRQVQLSLATVRSLVLAYIPKPV
jgi:hypothetical protein